MFKRALSSGNETDDSDYSNFESSDDSVNLGSKNNSSKKF